MRFIIDAHLPKSLTRIFKELGHIAIHTTDLPQENKTSDADITLEAGEDGIVISKDDDFYQSFLLYRNPPKLIFVKVGNMRLRELKALFTKVAPTLIELLAQHDLLELHKENIIVIA